MESKLKAAAMGSVGELPAGYLHLPTTPIKQEPELTDWFDGAKFVPAYVGDYETKKYSRIFKCFAKQHWDGKKWSAGWFNEIAMHIAKRMTPVNQSPTWRGIKK